MADLNSALGPLPNGWECRHDPRTRRNYFINFINKTTTWDDPRVTLAMLNAPPPYHEQTDVTMQPQLHGTPDHRSIYPSNPAHYHPQPAFHLPTPYIQELLRQDISTYRPSPVPGRAHTAPLMGSHAIGHLSSSKIQETSFSTAMATENSVAKISAMFPTVSETHIRALLIKYHSREAVVISALQVEKNPLTTPGPYSISTPPFARHIIIPPPVLPPNYHSTPPSGLRDFTSTPPPSLYSYGYGTGGTLTGSHASSSCMGSPAIRHSPRPHSSPKMKLRYMKSMFPKADETIILDTLYNVDNNVQAASNQLLAMGFDKKDSTPSHGTPSSKGKGSDKVIKNDKDKENSISTPTPLARLRSMEEKQQMRDKLKTSYPDLADQLILMALDSVDYDEKRAGHILNIMIKEESSPKSTQPNSACSSQRPQSSKSDDADVSSMGTKTTVEADVAVHSTQKSNDVVKPAEDNAIKAEQSAVNVVHSAESTTKAASVEAKTTSSKTASTNATIHPPPNKAASASEAAQLPANKSSMRKTRGKKDVPKVSRGTSTTEDKEYRSALRLRAAGPNSALLHGPNDDLLIEDYVTWAGPNRRAEKHISAARGPNKSLVGTHHYNAKGPNQETRRGPQKGLATGSLYSHLAACNAATTLVAVQSRGK